VTGKSKGVTSVVGGIVQHLRLRKADAPEQEDTEQRGDDNGRHARLKLNADAGLADRFPYFRILVHHVVLPTKPASKAHAQGSV